MEALNTFLGFADLILAVSAIVVGFFAVKAVRAIEGTQADKKANGALSRLAQLVFAFVRDVNDGYKQELLAAKDPASPEGTRITLEEAKELNKLVWEKLRDAYGDTAWKKLQFVLGLNSEKALASVVNAHIEQSVDLIEGRDTAKALEAAKK